jgi:hypothetical protein
MRVGRRSDANESDPSARATVAIEAPAEMATQGGGTPPPPPPGAGSSSIPAPKMFARPSIVTVAYRP